MSLSRKLTGCRRRGRHISHIRSASDLNNPEFNLLYRRHRRPNNGILHIHDINDTIVDNIDFAIDLLHDCSRVCTRPTNWGYHNDIRCHYRQS
jgi:hypothetical protein